MDIQVAAGIHPGGSRDQRQSDSPGMERPGHTCLSAQLLMAVVNESAVNTVQINVFSALCFISFGSVPRSGITGSYSGSIFNF